MKTSPIGLDDLQGVFAQPRLVRDDAGEIDWGASQKEVETLVRQGVTRFIYGGDALLGVPPEAFAKLTTWLQGFPKDLWAIPGVGPDWSVALEQAQVLSQRFFPCVLLLPGAEFPELGRWEQKVRSLHQVAKKPLALALRAPGDLGGNPESALQTVLRLMREGVILFLWCADASVAAWAAQTVDARRVVVGG
jgi:hypothetical protein